MFRDDLAAAHARIEALEHENAKLRAEIDRLTGRTRTTAPVVGAGPLNDNSIWLGSRIYAWRFPDAIYAGENTDDECYLRVANLARGTAVDHQLAPQSSGFGLRLGDRVIAQLVDLRLIAISITDGSIASLQLADPLVTRPFVDDGALACITTNNDLLRVDLDEWRVKTVEKWSASRYPIEPGHPDRCRARHEYKLEDDSGWRLDGVIVDGDELVLSLDRNMGNQEMAIGLAPLPEKRPKKDTDQRGRIVPRWITRIGLGDPSRLYVVDDLVVLHNDSLPSYLVGAVDRDGVLQFHVEQALSQARLFLTDGARSSFRI